MSPDQEATFGGGKRLILLEVFGNVKEGADVKEEFVRHGGMSLSFLNNGANYINFACLYCFQKISVLYLTLMVTERQIVPCLMGVFISHDLM